MENTLFFFTLGLAVSFLGWLLLGFIFFFLGKRFFRTGVQRIFDLIVRRLMEDKYSENLMELWSAVRRTSVQNILEIALRAEEGKLIGRPLGSPKPYNNFDNLMFIPAQLVRLPVESDVPIDSAVTLGPRAEKPMHLSIPLLIGGMGYGVALSEEAKVALAKAANECGTATNSGEGPFLVEERKAAGKFIWQISRYDYGRNPQGIAEADMIEVQMGQGSRLGAHTLSPQEIKGKAQKLMKVSPVASLKGYANLPGISSPSDWPRYVQELRNEVGGKPIGIKIMGGGRLEADLAVAIEAGFDVICIGGAQGGTAASSPTITDDFGMPSIYNLVRAQRYLMEQGVRGEVSLIASGGYDTPGKCLKAIALGADAVNLGTVPLFALVHRQIGKVMPWEPLTQLVYYNSKYKEQLNVDLAAQSVVNVIQSFMLEMEEGVRALGKKSIHDLGPNDLVALDDWTAEITGVPRAW
ncbi:MULTISPECIES: FMN-binding glutamate synthase family protein [Desulfitobacterium]|uniref:Glutamate synthase family protein n=1 Tax=Desulfitobacterium dehalogenans (strain ATCC 51507 / DSM 9161 / JW/IU-DC1) TaxID=756499 RepID=I4ADH5_DESDJ|nr:MULTISPECIES: FMN-binding glutamate synthase family protein [Desulfitobacterium]AFM02010.1 glutamate synthase family protein [Desulfitobacterium dehalogenans ATCC 51507]